LVVVRILIVDDYPDVRRQLRFIIEAVDEWEIAGEAASGTEAVEQHGLIQPHVTIMDFNMPKLNGLEAARLILQRDPDAQILLLTIFTSPELARQARKNGIRGFCSKQQMHCIIEAIEALLKGEVYFPEWLADSATA
jgi:DNA-binding NarL/FixJ family response regulator